MKWFNLKNNRCPECNGDFTKGLDVTEGGTIEEMEAGDMSGKMFIHHCGFMITEKRYKEIVEATLNKMRPGDAMLSMRL